MKSLIAKSAFLAILLPLSLSAHASLIGQWTFDNASDSTGNWQDLTLSNGAVIHDGMLDLSAGGLQWANTVWAGTGALGNQHVVINKTLVSWVQLTNPYSRTGSALTLDSSTTDNFNGLIWSENFLNTWQVGSSFGRNNVYLGPDAAGIVGNIVQVAATWQQVAGGININYYLDGVNVGEYVSANVFSWQTGNMEAIFGARHTSGTSTPIASGAGLDARIYEARIYDTALTGQQISDLKLEVVSAPSGFGFMLMGLAALATMRRRQGHEGKSC